MEYGGFLDKINLKFCFFYVNDKNLFYVYIYKGVKFYDEKL